MRQIAAFLIGATASGCGKTTFTMGMLRALRRRGYVVQPYKCGPDYIDPKFHNVAVGDSLSVNLDGFMCSALHRQELFGRYAVNADVAVVEGVMGLYDGYDGPRGSSAELAMQLDIPVILLVDARATVYSVAPILYGFKTYEAPELTGLSLATRPRIAGVVFNHVGSAHHYALLQEVCASVGIAALGYLPKMKDIEMPHRHLGLDTNALSEIEALTELLADRIEATVDVDAILQATQTSITEVSTINPPMLTPGATPLRIAVARDRAFDFTYRENLRRLGEIGRIFFFSPIEDAQLPDCDLLYLPGGYPEFALAELSANLSMRESIHAYAATGGRILAECGGMMYLCCEIVDASGMRYPMVGLLSQVSTMESMNLSLGYRAFEVDGEVFRGHEFHYSRVLDPLPSTCTLHNARGQRTDTAVWRVGHVIASYTHLYWGEKNLFSLFDGL